MPCPYGFFNLTGRTNDGKQRGRLHCNWSVALAGGIKRMVVPTSQLLRVPVVPVYRHTGCLNSRHGLDQRDHSGETREALVLVIRLSTPK